MFNPVSMVCDFDYKVTQIRPECAAAGQSDNTLVEDIFGTEIVDETIRQESKQINKIDRSLYQQEQQAEQQEELIETTTLSTTTTTGRLSGCYCCCGS